MNIPIGYKPNNPALLREWEAKLVQADAAMTVKQRRVYEGLKRRLMSRTHPAPQCHYLD